MAAPTDIAGNPTVPLTVVRGLVFALVAAFTGAILLADPAAAQNVDFKPSSAAAGDSVEYAGTCQGEFGAKFVLSWDSPQQTLAKASNPKAGRVEGSFVVPVEAKPGVHSLRAVCTAEGGSYDEVTPFDVEQPQPPDPRDPTTTTQTSLPDTTLPPTSTTQTVPPETTLPPTSTTQKAPLEPTLQATPVEIAAGGTLRVVGANHGMCDSAGAPPDGGRVTLVLDSATVLTRDAVVDGGAFSLDLLVPAGIESGEHRLTSHCLVNKVDRVVATTRIRVTIAPTTTTNGGPTTTTTPPPDPGGTQGRHRSVFPASLPSLGEISFAPWVVVRNLGLAALLMLLVGFPAELFNKTIEEHYDEMSSWFSRRRRPHRKWPTPIALPLFAAAAALLYALLDPDVTDDRATLALILGLFVAVLATTIASQLPAMADARSRLNSSTALRVFPKALVVAAVCVAISRLASFHPGYVYGIVAGYVLVQERKWVSHTDGRSVAIGAISLFAVTVAAWVAWTPLDHTLDNSQKTASLLVLFPDAILAALFVMGLECLAFGLVPLRILDGGALSRWSPRVWLALWGVAMFGFVHVLLDPETGRLSSDNKGAILGMVLLFIGFGAGVGRAVGLLPIPEDVTGRRVGRATVGTPPTRVPFISESRDRLSSPSHGPQVPRQEARVRNPCDICEEDDVHRASSARRRTRRNLGDLEVRGERQISGTSSMWSAKHVAETAPQRRAAGDPEPRSAARSVAQASALDSATAGPPSRRDTGQIPCTGARNDHVAGD